MPFTPFHLGPGLLVGLVCGRRLDLPATLAASVLVDIRTALVFFSVLDGPLHGPLHTLLGATLLAGVLTAAALPLRPLSGAVLESLRIPHSPPPVRIAAGALVGAWLHVFLDAVLYLDVQPFAPVSAANPALGLVGPLSVYLGCVVVGLLGLCLYAASLLGLVALPDPDPA